MYTLTLVTKPATLTIQQVDTQRSLVGSISSDTRLPITIQSFTDGKTWTLSTPLNAENRIFTTSFATVSPEWNVSYAGQNAFSVKRDSGFFTSQSGLVFEPDIRA